MRGIEPLLQETVARGASDLHVSAGSRPLIRLHGELVALEHPPLARAEARALCYGVLTEAQRRRFEAERELDFAVAVAGPRPLPRQPLLTRGTVGGAFRVIPADLPALERARAATRGRVARPLAARAGAGHRRRRAAARAPRSPP